MLVSLCTKLIKVEYYLELSTLSFTLENTIVAHCLLIKIRFVRSLFDAKILMPVINKRSFSYCGVLLFILYGHFVQELFYVLPTLTH